MDIGLFKLKTGDVIISKYILEPDAKKITFINPFVVVTGAIFPMMIADSAPEPKYTISTSEIFIGPLEPKEHHKGAYVKATSGLSLASSVPPGPAGGFGGPPPTRGGGVPPTRGGNTIQ